MKGIELTQIPPKQYSSRDTKQTRTLDDLLFTVYCLRTLLPNRDNKFEVRPHIVLLLDMMLEHSAAIAVEGGLIYTTHEALFLRILLTLLFPLAQLTKSVDDNAEHWWSYKCKCTHSHSR